jgi:hypothetical protein
VAFLAAVAILGYLFLIPRFYRYREPAMALIALMEVLILLLAASGILLVRGP